MTELESWEHQESPYFLVSQMGSKMSPQKAHWFEAWLLTGFWIRRRTYLMPFLEGDGDGRWGHTAGESGVLTWDYTWPRSSSLAPSLLGLPVCLEVSYSDLLVLPT